ncbi:MAG: helix-turn-helix domain-containing protein [Anaerolineae bacterium]|nr:helix-turn-helix domain-containing protein [Anaerolineae bacterium]
MNTTTAGRLLGVSAHQVARLARAGLLPGAHKVGRQWVIPDQAVAEALRNRPRARSVTPRAPAPRRRAPSPPAPPGHAPQRRPHAQQGHQP